MRTWIVVWWDSFWFFMISLVRRCTNFRPLRYLSLVKLSLRREQDLLTVRINLEMLKHHFGNKYGLKLQLVITTWSSSIINTELIPARLWSNGICACVWRSLFFVTWRHSIRQRQIILSLQLWFSSFCWKLLSHKWNNLGPFLRDRDLHQLLELGRVNSFSFWQASLHEDYEYFGDNPF